MDVTINIICRNKTLNLDLIAAIANYGSILTKRKKFATVTDEEILIKTRLETSVQMVNTATNICQLCQINTIFSL